MKNCNRTLSHLVRGAAGAALALLAASAAAADWKAAGESGRGHKVFVDTASVKRDGELVRATVKAQYKAPVKGTDGTISAMVASIRVRCKDSTSAADEVVYYQDAAATKVFRKTAAAQELGPQPEGSVASVAVKYLCK